MPFRAMQMLSETLGWQTYSLCSAISGLTPVCSLPATLEVNVKMIQSFTYYSRPSRNLQVKGLLRAAISNVYVSSRQYSSAPHRPHPRTQKHTQL